MLGLMGSLSQQETKPTENLNPTLQRRAVGKLGLVAPPLATGWRCGPRDNG